MKAIDHITCNDRVDLKDKFDVSSHELSPFLITIILTTANADVLYNDVRPDIENSFHSQIKTVVGIIVSAHISSINYFNAFYQM